MNGVKRLLRRAALLGFHIGFIRPALRIYWGVRYRGRSRVPKGPCLVVANHNSHVDAAILMSLFPLRRLPHVHPVAAADYFGTNPVRRFLAMLLMNGIPIERTAAAGVDPLSPIVKVLREGESLIFFPEGSRGEAGVVGPFRPGVGRLVRDVPGLLVVPVFLSGPERTWPRGTIMPMPLDLEAIVGKPRTYPADEDPRAIAEAVRRDVLALAPPPPPEPGPRPQPPLRVAVCGVDPEARHAAFLEIVARLGRLDRTLGLGEPILEADGQGVRECTRRLPLVRSRWGPAFLAWAFRTGGLHKGSKFAETVERARLVEALGDGTAARLLVSEGDPLVELLAWAEADFYRGVFDEKGLERVMLFLSGERRIPLGHWWRLMSKAPAVWLLNVFDLARPTPPDVLVLARVSVPRAMEKVRSRGEPLEAYQNEAFLDRLQEAYAHVASLLRRRGKAQLLELDVEAVGPERIGEEVASACARRLVAERQLTPSG